MACHPDQREFGALLIFPQVSPGAVPTCDCGIAALASPPISSSALTVPFPYSESRLRDCSPISDLIVRRVANTLYMRVDNHRKL